MHLPTEPGSPKWQRAWGYIWFYSSLRYLKILVHSPLSIWPFSDSSRLAFKALRGSNRCSAQWIFIQMHTFRAQWCMCVSTHLHKYMQVLLCVYNSNHATAQSCSWNHGSSVRRQIHFISMSFTFPIVMVIVVTWGAHTKVQTGLEILISKLQC